MRMYDLIIKKRDGGEHTKEEIKYIVSGFTGGKIPDYQMASWLMCVYYKGMTNEEIVELTKAMAESGDMLDLSRIDGIKVDKHSTGGVGDKTTFIVAPILASLGVPIAKMSGRGLGHTGGTIDKLESIEGFDVSLPEEKFIENVNKIKLSLVGQTGNLAPADKKIYALRDVIAAVDSIPLIASSIMSKKLAAGADVIVLDVKCGSGAFMKNEDEAKKLARTMVDIGNMAGRKTYGIITDMNEPLGCKVGNSLEVEEAVSVLQISDLSDAEFNKLPKGIRRLLEVSLTLAAYMYMGAHEDTDFDSAKIKCEQAITSGSALLKFAEFVRAQGGNIDSLLETGKLKQSKYIEPVYFPKCGYITGCNTSEVGMANLCLGGGRATKESCIDLYVGIDIRKHIGDEVSTDEPFAYIHASDTESLEEAKKRLILAYAIGEEKPVTEPIIKSVII